ncbi:MAG TPA: hypothetical protein VHT75_02305 [Acidimicrobiales bacterium]|jgi:hypothetical protein|nr:hypothetical protein [Acidimicrobiales bacterium]
MTTPHLDDEALSAAFDGEATAAEQAHLRTCPACRARLQPLATVARAVGQPVVPPPLGDVDRAVALALQSAAPTAPTASDTHSPIVPSAPTAPTATGRPARRPGRWLGPAAGVAAAAVLAIVGLAVLLGRSHPSVPATTAARAPAAGGGAAPSSPTSATLAPALANPPADLGNQTDAATVAQLVRAATQPATSGPSSSGAQAGAASSGPAPSVNGGQPLVVCESSARNATGLAADSSATVRYQARLVWRDQPAVVVVFSRSGGLAGAIIKTADCSVLAVLPL